MAAPLATGQNPPGGNHNHLTYRLNSCKYVICSRFLFYYLEQTPYPQRHHCIKGNFSLLAPTISIPRTMFSPSTCWQYDTKLSVYFHGPWKQAQKSSCPFMVSQFGFKSLSLESIVSLDHFCFSFLRKEDKHI